MVDVIGYSTRYCLWMEPVVFVGGVLTGLGPVVPGMSNIATDFACHMQIYGLDGALHCFFFVGTLVQPLH